MADRTRLVEKSGSIVSSLSGTLSLLGGYQVCHNICLGLIAVLSLVGISLVGMPLLFLTKVALPFWIVAAFLFIVSLLLYLKGRCLPRNLLLLNGGIVIAGVPFNSLENVLVYFWLLGGAMVLLSIVLFFKDKIARRQKKNHQMA